jgi:hypothetical protein
MKKYLLILALALAATLVFTFVSCDDNPFVAVTGISGVPSEGYVGENIPLPKYAAPLDLTIPPIEWTIKNKGGNAGLTIEDFETEINFEVVTVKAVENLTATGNIVITGTVKNGVAKGSDYVKDFTIGIGGVNVIYEFKFSGDFDADPYSGTGGTNFTSAALNRIDAAPSGAFIRVHMETTGGEDRAGWGVGTFLGLTGNDFLGVNGSGYRDYPVSSLDTTAPAINIYNQTVFTKIELCEIVMP